MSYPGWKSHGHGQHGQARARVESSQEEAGIEESPAGGAQRQRRHGGDIGVMAHWRIREVMMPVGCVFSVCRRMDGDGEGGDGDGC